jgi:GPH family glycoside/pentoside/hexuronide:cation symporter
MGFLGFVANQTQSPSSLHGLVSLMSIYPMYLGLLSLAIMVFLYPLNAKRMSEIALALKIRRADERAELPAAGV